MNLTADNKSDISRSASRPKMNEWLGLNFKIGAFSFGGAGRIIQYREIIVDEKGWMDSEEFSAATTVTQIFPGPIIVNLVVYLGYYLNSSFVAILGVLLLGLPGALLAVFLFNSADLKNVSVQWLFQGFSIGSVMALAIFIWTGAKGLVTVANKRANRKTILAKLILAFSAAAASLLRVPILVVLSMGTVVGLMIEFLL
jgi:chromate transport protein ChrA